ncbi:uncharacterized protein GVI51_H06919 [Nakaseomyces glabratus]|uniref:ATP synthase F(0) complex subunit e, mitochondrial n=2 Tax=Candida glabrata TaxID=5478 RepID=B4UN10_CANGA|nr:uncharacterized protein CAGL0H07023g [Nakaseomyces glabratus]KAH7586295.1 ATP synthase E chain [Nakaseomyces glabratus]KAH7587880.1 ATP synthase E chain [Nakaseomyces glabratus]KAH7592267.1 ATP synthase E chain [Nakaseomyces glabratus]KAH7600912.1 ATP synthase E chain [Nakaseomyces glabratus]KAH7601532.1 ATP synthase E chain [Nakaseomyces glabratus]|eukprot:XP_002999553.1 uncharacterized protein CAGL0H07023g [[Candida] glabrata]
MSTVNVLRYSALGLGLLVGLKTDFSLRGAAAKKLEEEEFSKRQQLIADAKAEWAKLHPPKTKATTKEINFDDPNLDFGELIVNAVNALDA